MDPRFICRVCGFVHDVPIWDDFGNAVLHEQCLCCGVSWGVEDTTLDDIRRYRAEWLAAGAPWVWPSIQPDDWEVELQLVNIPRSFR